MQASDTIIYRENNHRNPFTGTPYDFRFHEVAGNATTFSSNRGVKPFLNGMLGYQWSRGDIQSLRTYDHEWVWGAPPAWKCPFADSSPDAASVLHRHLPRWQYRHLALRRAGAPLVQ
jgi:hypothetical protein